ncbi:MAG: crossover junction endodeoxyribonuclease RuvC, partial [Flavobacteriales bacterium]
TGNGNASKEQVAAMIQQLLKIPTSDMPDKLDATDGLAAAVCHYFQTSGPMGSTQKHKGWAAFIKAQPDRIKK